MSRLDRIRGSLLAGACGDALGNPVEFDSGESIRRQYGARGVREMQLVGGAALITDDTQMTLFTAEGLLNSQRFGAEPVKSIHQSYLDWLNTQGYAWVKGCYHQDSLLIPVRELHHRRAPGGTCLSALASGDMGCPEVPINNSKGCGGVMRTAPCGMLNLLPEQGEDAYALQGAMAAAITHGHRMGYVPAAMLADMVHMILLDDGRTLEEITLDSLSRMSRLFAPAIEDAQGCENREDVSDGSFAQLLAFRTLMRKAVLLAKTDAAAEEAIGQLGEGWVGDEALAIAVYCCLKYPDSMEDCLSAAVSHGGDSDSTGAIAGNLLGAWLGAAAIPQRWLASLEARETIEMMANRLAQGE